MRNSAMATLFILLLAVPAISLGDTIVHIDSVDGGTDLYRTMTVPQFDGSQTLLSITIEASGWLDGAFHFENLAPENAGGFNIMMNDFTGQFFLGGAIDNGSISGGDLLFDYNASMDPSGDIVWMENYDGVTDFEGPSGITLPYATNNEWSMILTPENELFANFVGSETVDFSVSQTVWSFIFSYGPLVLWNLETTAGYDLTVTYEFDGVVATENTSFDSFKALYR